MLHNYLTIAFRNLLRQKGHSFINIAGLSVGLACSFFIVLWAFDEMSFDKFHEHRDELHRAMRHVTLGGQTYTWSGVPKPLADVLEKDYPEIEDVVLLSWPQFQLLTVQDQTFRERGYFAGPAFFESFTFPLIVGDPATVISSPDAIAISDRLARKFFGDDWRTEGDILGRIINLDHRKDFRIAGVFEDVPDNSTLRLDYVVAMEDFLQRNDWVEHWGNSGMEIYVRLKQGASAETLNEKIADLINRNHESASATVFLKPFDEIRLYSDYRDTGSSRAAESISSAFSWRWRSFWY